MKPKKTLYFIIIILTLFGIIPYSIYNYIYNLKSVNAMIIILGRHANANAFHEEFYDVLDKYIRETIYGGYIGVITSEGKPRIIERFDYFEANISNRNERRMQIDEDTRRVLNFLKDEEKRAITPENDLLRAIQEANRLLNVFEEKAKRDEKKIGRKQIIVMDAGIVTTGALDFSVHDIDNFDFSVFDEIQLAGKDEKIKEFSSGVAEKLSTNRLLPDLKDVNVVFIGLGDVALPQKELSVHVQNGLKILWTTIFNKANAASIVISPYISTYKANKHTDDESGFPEVRSIEFLDSTGWSISNEQINFPIGQCVYSNSKEAKKNLKRFADIIIRYINMRPNVKIYVVGSESKDQDREYTTVLSECRAKTTMGTLEGFDVPRDKMEAFGLAVYLPKREDDRPNNVFDPVIGAKNQKVILIPSDIGNQAFLREVLVTRDKINEKR
jgi:outer membrane protein OmpA-like peptidoglycan-associated protein